MKVNRVLLALVWLAIVLFILFGLFTMAQEILVPNTEIPTTIALERFNRAFCFILGAGFVMVWHQIVAWHEEATRNKELLARTQAEASGS